MNGGENNVKVCSNLFLTAQLQLKLGKYAEALANNKKVTEMCEGLKGDFGEDYNILASKFYKQQADLAFVMGNLAEAKVAAEKGLELVKQVDLDTDAQTRKATDHCHRDLLNLVVRVRSKLEKKDASELRREVAQETGKNITFMAQHDDAMQILDREITNLTNERNQLQGMLDRRGGQAQAGAGKDNQD